MAAVKERRLTRAEMAVHTLLPKYETLVWYARKPPKGEGYWPETPADIRERAYKAIDEAERKYPKECEALAGENGDWEHGFNSGMLAGLRYVLSALNNRDQALQDFPELDT